jgi:glycosyltransferase 2 family protein
MLWLAFRSVNFSRLLTELKEANYAWILLSFVFAFLAFVSRARRWIILINPLGYNPSLKNTYNAMMTGYLANLALPRIGEVTRCVALGKKEKIPVDQLIGTVVVERTIDFLSLLFIMMILILTSGKQISSFLNNDILVPVQERILSFLGASWILWAILIPVTIIILILVIIFKKKLRKIGFISRMFDLTLGIFHGLKTITNLKRRKEFIFHTVFMWTNYTFMTWVVVLSIKSTSHLDLTDGLFLVVVGGFAMSAPVQSGLGAYHYLVSRGLFFVMGIPITDGLVYAVLAHESELIFIAILGTISFFVISHKRDKIVMPEVTDVRIPLAIVPVEDTINSRLDGNEVKRPPSL